MSLTETDFAFVTGLVRQRSSIDLQPGKEYLVESRLAPVARQFGDRDVNALVGRLRAGDSALSDAVVDALTTNETSWFRDSHPFSAFTKTLLPDAAARCAGSVVNIWSAACSSGQEAYSLAMLVLDWMPANPGIQVRITGTDISQTMVDRAREGRYSQLEVNRGLPAKYLVRHFEQHGRDWTLRPEVRAMTRFERGNLAQPPVGVPQCDVVFLRNVLIYFDLATKRAVLQNVRRVLRPGGFLVLGGAESALSLDNAFHRLEVEKVVVFRHGGDKIVNVFTDLDAHARADLDLILTDVLSSVLAEEAVATHNQLPQGPLAVARLAIHDQVNHGYAVVEVRAGVSLARVIAARMMSVASPAPEDIVDAVAELGNIAGGNVKTLLCHHARLSLPMSEITEQAPFAEVEPHDGGAYVRAMVLGHVAQLAIRPDAAIDGLIWPPICPDEILERSP